MCQSFLTQFPQLSLYHSAPTSAGAGAANFIYQSNQMPEMCAYVCVRYVEIRVHVLGVDNDM